MFIALVVILTGDIVIELGSPISKIKKKFYP